MLHRQQQIAAPQGPPQAPRTPPPARSGFPAERPQGGSSMTEFQSLDFDTMTPADFEQYLPEFFAHGDGHVSTDPRLQTFLKNNPDCAALVRDLEAIADQARSLFEPSEDQEPSD